MGAFFLLNVRKSRILQDTPGGNLRDKEAVRRGASPPLSGRICGGGGKAALGFAPPLRAAGPCAVPRQARAGIRPD